MDEAAPQMTIKSATALKLESKLGLLPLDFTRARFRVSSSEEFLVSSQSVQGIKKIKVKRGEC